MSDTLPEDAWVNEFLNTPPRPLLSALQRRLQASTAHVNALAEVYKQRAIIESQYAESLQKLVKSAESGQLAGKGGNEWGREGGEARIWESVLADLRETSTSHSTLATMIRTDFESPLRELPNKITSWRRIGDQDASLDRTLKEYEKVSGKRDKAEAKSKGGKADLLQQEVNQLSSQLMSLSPMVYSTYQKLDEDRLRALKETVVRFGSVRGDMATRDGERADSGMAAMLGWEPSDEVRLVGRRLGGAGTSGGSRPLPPSATPSAQTTPRALRRLSSATSNTNNDFSPRPSVRQNGSSSNAGTGSSGGGGFAGGLKSMLGRKNTTANRGRSSSIPNSTRSGQRDAFETLNEDEDVPPPHSSQPPNLIDDEGYSEPPADRHRNPWEEPDEEITPAPISRGTSGPTPGGVSLGAAAGAPAFATTFDSSPTASQENLSSSASSQQQQQQRMNFAITSAPIQETEEERQAALAKMQQALSLPPQQPQRRATTARGRRDVRSTMFGGPSADVMSGGLAGSAGLGQSQISESPESSNQALPPISNGALDPSTPNKPQATRQMSAASIGSNNPFDSPGLGSFSPTATGAVPTITSSGSEGLRASMTETINAVMRNGAPVRIQITGEIHLSLVLHKSLSSASLIHIRLTDFESLEKIAPNPAYLAQVPDRPGEYFLNPEVLSSASRQSLGGSGKGTLLFKYQVHIPPGKELAALPMILEPAFQCKDGETRMIINHRLNSGSPLAAGLTGSEMTLLASFAPGTSVRDVQAKPPGGVWSPSNRRMSWKVPIGDGPAKAVARLITEPGEAMVPQGVQCSWAMEGALGSGLGVEVVSGSDGIQGFEEVKKGLTTGKYLAEPV